MEENALIQPTRQGVTFPLQWFFRGTYLRAGWKMIPLFILCLLQDTSALKGPRLVTGDPGGMVTIKCHYTPTPVNRHQRKYWCRLYPPQRLCHTIISTNFFISQSYQGRVTLLDFPSSGMFVVTLAQLAPKDTGYYRCGIGPRTDMLFVSMNLTVSTAQVNHSLGSARLTIPSSIIPTTTLATRGQIMETLRRSTSVTGGQGLDTTLLAEGWGTRTSRRDPTTSEITQAPGTIRTTTVAGGQDLDITLLIEGWETRTIRRNTTPGDISQAPETIRTTSVTGGQGLDTTLLAEGWGTRTSRRNTTPGDITQAPETIRTTTVAGGQDLDTTLLVEGWETGTSRRNPTIAEVTQVPGTTGATAPDMGGQFPKTIKTTTSAPGGQIFDADLFIKGQGPGTCRGHITPTKALGTIGTITSVAGRQGPGTLGKTTTIGGTQDLDSLVVKGQEAGISRDITLTRVTQLPAQASSKNIQTLGTVRLPIPGTGDWFLETTRAANLVPEGQTSGAKVTSNVMEGGLVLGTRAVTKMIVETIRERRSTIRSTNRLTEGIVNIRTPLITTIRSPGTTRPSAMVRDSLREVTPGTDQQTQGITIAAAPDGDVGVWFSGTIRKGKVSALGGTAAVSRERPSEEPLRRITGAALLIPSNNKPFTENSSPDQGRISHILITLSTVLLPFVLLVLLLLLRKLRKRVCEEIEHKKEKFAFQGYTALQTQEPTFSPNPAN